jgi:hypothetical protein
MYPLEELLARVNSCLACLLKIKLSVNVTVNERARGLRMHYRRSLIRCCHDKFFNKNVAFDWHVYKQ